MHRTIIVYVIICDKITDKKYMQHDDKWLQIPDHQYKTKFLFLEDQKQVKVTLCLILFMNGETLARLICM